MRTRNLISTALKALALGGFALVFGEVFIRVADPQPLIPRYITGSPEGIRANIANARYWHQTPEISVEMRINAQGMRDDREYPQQKPPGTCRVGLFGDSFFMGYELNLADTMPVRMQEQLKQQGYSVEFLNFAVSGFGTGEMLRRYDKTARNFNLDMALFQLHGSDGNDNLRSNLFDVKDGAVSPTERIYLPAVGLQDRLMRWWIYRVISDKSHLYSFIREWASIEVRRVMAMLRGRAVEAKTEQDEEEQATDGPGVILTGALLKYGQATLAQDGVEFMVVGIPAGFGTRVRDTVPTLLPTEDATALKVINPFASLKAAADQGEAMYYQRGHRHLTPKGAELVARDISKVLLNSPKLANCRN